MIFTVYFLLCATLLFSLTVFVIGNNSDSVVLNPDLIKQDQFNLKVTNSVRKNSLITQTRLKSKLESSVELEKDSEYPELEIKRKSLKLKRDLKTLNYISILEVRPSIINDPERLEEVRNLKVNLQRQIIKNTRLLNEYRLNIS